MTNYKVGDQIVFTEVSKNHGRKGLITGVHERRLIIFGDEFETVEGKKTPITFIDEDSLNKITHTGHHTDSIPVEAAIATIEFMDKLIYNVIERVMLDAKKRVDTFATNLYKEELMPDKEELDE